MPPNAKPIFTTTTTTLETEGRSSSVVLTDYLLDKQADTTNTTNGVVSSNKMSQENEDWKDVKQHSEQHKTKRGISNSTRLLDDGVLIKLMKKSDYEGLKRLFINLSIMGMTAYAIYKLGIYQDLLLLINKEEDQTTITFTTIAKFVKLLFIPLYCFYSFQFQCFAFAGQHEFLHRNAFKTKWINDLALFYTSVVCFECGKHEKYMHKQHHTYTNNIHHDPELTSYYTSEILENNGFRNIPLSKMSYIFGFLDVWYTFKCRIGRIINSACGVPVDYSGTGWSLKDWTLDSSIVREIQLFAIAQICHYIVIFTFFGRSIEGLQFLAFWWLLPVILGYPFVNYFRNLEHADCDVSNEEQPQPNMNTNCLQNTRSVRSNPLIRLLLWDTNYHAEHHCYPMVPFYNLHKINELLSKQDAILHNECNHFTSQNWTCWMSGGWIDQQKVGMDAYAYNEMKKKSE